MSRRPLVPVLLVYLAALAAAARMPLTEVVLWIGAGSGALGAVALAWWGKHPRLATTCALLSVFAFGVLRARVAEPRRVVVPLFPAGEEETYEGIVESPPRVTLRTTQLVVRLQPGRRAPGGRLPRATRVLVVAKGRATCRVGDTIRFTTRLAPAPHATNPGQFCPACYEGRKGLALTGFVSGIEVLRVSVPASFRLRRAADDARRRLVHVLGEAMAAPYRRLYTQVECSVLYGVHAAPLPENIVEAFRRSGTIHLLVVSGTQVAFLVGLLLALSSGLPRWIRLWLLAPTLLFYVFLTGEPPSIVRAAIVGLVGVIAVLWGRDIEPLNALAFAGLVVLIAKPTDLFNVGLQLSFAACWGIITLAGPATRWLSRFLPRPVALLVAATCGAQAGVTPLLAHYFTDVSLVAPLANLVAVPTAAGLLFTGLATCLAAPLGHGVAHLLGGIAHGLTHLLLGAAFAFGKWPGAVVHVSPPGALWLCVAFGVAALTSVFDHEVLRRWLLPERLVTAAVVAVTLTVGWVTWRHCRPRPLVVTVLDVGQGDSLVIQSPTGRTVLVDGGSHDRMNTGVGQRVIVPYLRQAGVTKLEAILLTHRHEDHVNGTPSVLLEVPTARLLDPQGPPGEFTDYEGVRALARRQGLVVARLRRGAVLNLGGGARLWVLWPPEQWVEGTRDDENNNSLVLKLTYGRTSFLLTGDLEDEGERHLLGYHDDLRSTVLKAGHHGGRGTTSQAFLDAVQPRICVISVGRHNRFGHPAAETLQRLGHTRVRIYRTDYDGAVTFRSDGTHLRVTTFRSQHAAAVLRRKTGGETL